MSRHNPRLRTNNQFPKLNTDQKAAQVASAPPGPLSDVETKLMEIRQKVERNRARWSRHGYEWFSRRMILLASEETRWASCRKIAARP